MSATQFSSKEHASRFRIGTLLYFSDEADRLLLIRRKRPPNLGLWCAVGGKLEMPTGESPYECAIREAAEEVGVSLRASDLGLRCLLSEKDYEETGHWLMFVYQVRVPLRALPPRMEEGEFRFFDRTELEGVEMPALDRQILFGRILTDDESLHFLRSDGDALPLVEESRIG
ncbi:NUDIX domain-containing protein [Pelagicoccus sp. SDUM812002]|uniref:NUDIX hydrolase n=1 Tax=Pelagicoccus sp. SDUM812002 TaxID=3041266 RepID=UPI00280DCC3A|nr:NUDIX domain-containing protein [Pelagicoccus sp. SDUM812002]MDQ8186458.1 NUDIX domain-containing protein [Pelagicoccus sp. SDUM812002]